MHGVTKVCVVCLSAIKGVAARRPSAMIAAAIEAASAESMTLRQIAMHVEEVHGTPLPCRLEMLSVTLRHEGFSYERG